MSSDGDILHRNLAALARTAPGLAQRLRETPPADLAWAPTRSGLWSATVPHEGRSLQLASRYDPAAEARTLVRQVDLGKNGAVVVLGIGLGYHVADLAGRLDDQTILVVFEPDLALLRAVLERIDHSAWLGSPQVVLADVAMDRPALVARLERFGCILTQGTALLHHAPARQRFPDAVSRFCQLVTEVLNYCRMHVATALVNSARTVENVTGNLAWYVGGANTNELHQAAAGFPAVCVGAGPSLARNVDRLRDPTVRRNVVVITAQTTLKPLLDRGIRPDFVTALDYHEISRRFYEGLPDLPDVTLVAEPKTHRSVLESFPGPIRITANGFLTRLLGPLAPPILPIRQGSTVAHLSVYLAQHLGCDPIILIGQDLGFSDGLYYCPGTAIHEVWAPELGAFNTLEMMEWQRVVRHRGHLTRRPDVHGQPIYTDEQMTTYLGQFERDFAAAPQRIIDASEGGLPKQHTTRLTLREALAQHAARPVPALPVAARGLDGGRLRAAAALLRRRLDEVREIRATSRDTLPLLRQMLQHQREHDRASRIYEKVQARRRQVEKLADTFALVNELNTIGAFKRARTDRAIQHSGADAFARQRRQIERDLENLDWLIQACDEALAIFGGALENLEARPESAPTPTPPRMAPALAAAH